MKIIPRYMLQHFLPVFLLALSAFVGLYLIIDFFEKIDNMLEAQVSLPGIVLYFFYRIPYIATQGIPMAALLGTLISLGILKRNREITAFRAAGVSPVLYTRPILVAGLAIVLLHFAMAEMVVHPLSQRANRIWQKHVQHRKASIAWGRENVWYHGQNMIYQIRLYDQRRQVLEKVSMFYLDSRFNLLQRMDVKRLRWKANRWIAEEGLIIKFDGSETKQEWFQERLLELPQTPEDFSIIERLPEELDWLSLYRYVRKIRQEGLNSTTYQVELSLRTAFPFTTLVLTLLGIAMAMRQKLHQGIAVGVVAALVVALIYLTVLQVGCSLATAEVLPPFLGVWAGNFLFAALAGYLWVTDSQ